MAAKKNPDAALTRQLRTQKRRASGAALERRFEAVLGGHGSTARLARALGKSASHLHRYWAGSREVPEYMVAILEFLETVPPEQWPKRWKDRDDVIAERFAAGETVAKLAKRHDLSEGRVTQILGARITKRA